MAEPSKAWSMFSLAAALGAALVARKTLDATWRLTTGKQPPNNAADPDVNLKEALTWAVASGVVVALSRMLVGRKAARYYARSTGNPPTDLPTHT